MLSRWGFGRTFRGGDEFTRVVGVGWWVDGWEWGIDDVGVFTLRALGWEFSDSEIVRVTYEKE